MVWTVTPSSSKGSCMASRTFCTTSRAPSVVASGEQQAELVAAEAGDGVALPQQALEALGERGQQPVAVLVPQRVVDLLEVVEVEEDERDTLVAAAGLGRAQYAEAVAEQRPVGEAGEPVVERLASQRGGHHGGPGHVVERDADGALAQREGLQRVGLLPVGAQLFEPFDGEARAAGGDTEEPLDDRVLARSEQLGQEVLLELGAGPAEELHRRRVGGDDRQRAAAGRVRVER